MDYERFDVVITDHEALGLPADSVVRMKLFTLDHRFILAKRGKLVVKDRKAVSTALSALLGS